jgi:cytoskeletal protein CcmA (bactofilin family)
MPDKKISEFNTFTGATGEDVFFVVASGETENSSAKNYKIPYVDLKSDLGLDAGGGGSVIGGDQDNINFGGTQSGDVRNINFQQGGENVMVIDQGGDVNLKNDLYVSGDVSGNSGYFENINISDGLTVSGGISGDYISGKTGVFTDVLLSTTGYFQEVIVSGDTRISGDLHVKGTTYVHEVVDTTVSGTVSGYTGIFNTSSGKTGSFTESLLISGEPVLTGFEIPGGGAVIGGDVNNIDFGGTDPNDFRNINFQQGGENVMVIDQDGDVNIQNDLHVSGNISGDIISGKTGVFTETLLSENTLGNNASFTTSLLISGKPVSTGAGGTVGGLPVVGGDQDNIDFGGTEPGDDRPINFQQGGENVMVIDQGGDVNIQNDLHVTGNISGGIISGKTGVFTDSLSVSGVSVLTGNQQASIQWLEDIGGGYLTVKESSVDGINFINTKWIDSAQSNGDIYYDDGQVGIGTNDPQFDIDVNGSANISDVLYIGGVRISGNQDGDLVFG